MTGAQAKDVRQDASAAAATARTRWAKMKADAAAKMDDLQAGSTSGPTRSTPTWPPAMPTGPEDDAAAIGYAAWTVDNARLAVLDAIDARVYADELAQRAGR